MDFYSEIGGITCLLLGLSRGRFGGGGGGGGGVAAGAKKIRYPWFLMAQGIAAGSVGYLLGSAVGLPLQKVMLKSSLDFGDPPLLLLVFV